MIAWRVFQCFFDREPLYRADEIGVPLIFNTSHNPAQLLGLLGFDANGTPRAVTRVEPVDIAIGYSEIANGAPLGKKGQVAATA